MIRFVLPQFLILCVTILINDCRHLFDLAKWQKSNARVQDIKTIADCVFNVSRTYAAGRSIVFISEQMSTDLSEYLVREMKNELKIIASPNNVSKAIGFFLFFHRDKEATTGYANILEKLPANNVMRFVVVFDFQERIDLRQIQTVMEEFWLFQIIDVVTLVPFRMTDNLRVYTYYPFSASRCGETGPPILINVWNSRRKAFFNRLDLFSRTKKVFNLHGCPLKCAGINRPPESAITQVSGNLWQLSGTGGKVFRFVEKHMNFSAKISLYQKAEEKRNHKIKNTTSSYFSRFDLAFGKFIRILDSEPNADFITENRMDCFTWAVPHGIGRQPSIWTKYTIEFPPLLWLFILLNILIVSIVVKWIVYRLHIKHSDWRGYAFVLFWTFSTFIGATVKLKSRSSILRVFVAQWLLYSLVLTATYQAFMGSLMTIPRTEPEIDRQVELLNTGLNLIGGREMYNLLNESTTASVEFRRLIERFFILPPVDFDTVMNRMARQRDVAVITSKRQLIYYAIKRRRNWSEKSEIHIFSDCVIKSYSAAFMLRKGSPFQNPVHRILTRLIETGIYDNWDTEYVLDEIFHNIVFSKETVLVLKELYGAFVVLFGGLALSTVVFFMEIFVKLLQEKR